MSELISGKKALIALANGEDVQLRNLKDSWYKEWTDYNSFKFKTWIGFFIEGESSGYEFRIKPRTITINNIEVPAPFEPKCMEDFYVISGTHSQGWINGNPANPSLSMGNLKWRTKEDIVQVVAALREVFK